MITVLKNKKGITLLEVIIVLGLISILSALVFGIFNYGVRTYNRTEVKGDLQRNTRIAMDYIVQEVRFATGEVDVGNDGRSISFEIEGVQRSFFLTNNRLSGIGVNITTGDVLETIQFHWDEETLMLDITITAKRQEETYQLHRSVRLWNLGLETQQSND